MPDIDDVQDGKNYHIGVPPEDKLFFLKGSNSLDWGMKNRLPWSWMRGFSISR